jgi:hypothetical protein
LSASSEVRQAKNGRGRPPAPPYTTNIGSASAAAAAAFAMRINRLQQNHVAQIWSRLAICFAVHRKGMVPKGEFKPLTADGLLPPHPVRRAIASSAESDLILPASKRMTLMPRFDLRQADGTLDPLAPFKVLAVMCHPNNRIQREKMLGNIEKKTGVARPRRQPMTADAFMQEVQRTSRRAAVAGGLLLTKLQLHQSGRRPSLNQAIPLVTALLPQWQQPQSPYWSRTSHYDHRPHSRTNVLRADIQFRTVAHFWGALLHSQQHDRQDIWPGTRETLPTFLAYAEAIRRLACALPSFAGNRRAVITRSEAWSFIVPQGVAPASLSIMPLNEEQLAILNEQEKLKTLI